VVWSGEIPLEVQISGLIELEDDQRVYLHFPLTSAESCQSASRREMLDRKWIGKREG